MASCSQSVQCSLQPRPTVPATRPQPPDPCVQPRVGRQPLDPGLAARASFPLCQTEGSRCPLTPLQSQGNCYVWNLTGGIGDEVTQLIPKTKIPAHTRYALQCRFSPDSTCVRGLGAQSPRMAKGCRVGVAADDTPITLKTPTLGFSPPARPTRRARSGGRPTSP